MCEPKIGETYIIRKPCGSREEIVDIGPGWFSEMDKYNGYVITFEADNFGQWEGEFTIGGWWFSNDWLELYYHEDDENIEVSDIDLLF